MITAEQILDSREFQKAFQEIDADLIGRLRSASPQNLPLLQEIAMKLWALDEVRAEFQRRMNGAESRINQGKV